MEIAKRAYSPKEFCARYRTGLRKLYYLLEQGVITAKKNGDLTLIDHDEAERWFKSLPTYPVRKSGSGRRVSA